MTNDTSGQVGDLSGGLRDLRRPMFSSGRLAVDEDDHFISTKHSANKSYASQIAANCNIKSLYGSA